MEGGALGENRAVKLMAISLNHTVAICAIQAAVLAAGQ